MVFTVLSVIFQIAVWLVVLFVGLCFLPALTQIVKAMVDAIRDDWRHIQKVYTPMSRAERFMIKALLLLPALWWFINAMEGGYEDKWRGMAFLCWAFPVILRASYLSYRGRGVKLG